MTPVADRLSLLVTHADGSTTRWGPEEADAESIPGALSFATSIPGGYKDLSSSLLRRISLEQPDQSLFDDVKVLGPGNEIVWHGRWARFPRSHGDQYGIDPGALGWVSHLRDDQTFSMIYVDRDLGGWGVAARQRRANLLGASYAPADASTRPDTTTGSPCLATEVTGAWTASSLPISEAWYDAGPGNTIGSLYYAWTKGAKVNNADGNWNWYAFLGNDDVNTSYDVTSNLRAAGPGTGTLTATVATRRFAGAQLYYAAGPAGAANLPYNIDWTCLAVYGNHGLTTQGTGTATSAPGLYGSDIVADIVSRAAPRLTYTTGADGSIQPSSFVIPHFVARDPGRAEDAILQVNKFHFNEWGVYHDQTGSPEFFWRTPDPDRLCWEARLSEGAHLELEGDDADEIYSGVLVVYKTPDGTTHTVGPPGSTADATDSTLADSDETNPATVHGLRRWAVLQIGEVTTQAGAAAVGAAFMIEKAQPGRRGSLTLTGSARHPTKGLRPAWEVRAGDYIRIADHSADVPRRIIETRYDHATRHLSCTLDNTVFRIDSLLERLGVSLVGVV